MDVHSSSGIRQNASFQVGSDCKAKTPMGAPVRSATGNIPALELFAQRPGLLRDKIHLFVAELKA
jgi:hypothetical protein